MSESGQPGAATPGEHGDGTGQHDDLARSASGWAPSATGWSRGGETGRERVPAWRRSDRTAGWGASSPHHGDLPAPVPGLPTEESSARVNGHSHVNGVHQAGEETPVARQAPVSAPPADEQRRGSDSDRLAVPAQRPRPSDDQPSAEVGSGPARHSSDDPPATRASRRSEGAVPSSAPPPLQVPPVGAAASGFEVPPGFHAPTVDRSAAEPAPSVSRGLADRFPTEPPAEPLATPADEPEWPGPDWQRPSWEGGWAPTWSRDEEPVGRRAREERAGEWAPEPTPPYEPARAEPTPPYEPARAEPTPPYEPARAEPTPPYEPARAEPTPPYEPARAEPTPPYEPARAEPTPPYEPAARETMDRPSWAAGAPAATPFSPPTYAPPTSAPPVPRGAPTSAPPVQPAAPASAPPVQREATASAPSHIAPASAPPRTAPASAPPAAYDPSPGLAPDASPADASRAAEGRGGAPFRLRQVAREASATAPAEVAGHPPTHAATGPAPVTGGVAHFDRTPAPAPTSAPPYAARRSAPEPVPTAEPVADTRPTERGSAVLPQRVPAEPDVPVVPEPPAVEPSAETPELARIATHLRRDDEPAPLRERPEGFDVNAILDAVREVAGVRDAALRRTPAGAHSLRLDLADGADPAEVSRQVARLLQERMGLAAAPQNLPGTPAAPPPPVRRRSAEARDRSTTEAHDRSAAEARADRSATRADRSASETRANEGRVGAPRAGEAPDARTAEGRAGESRFAPGRQPEGRAGRRAEAGVVEGREAEAATARVGSPTETEPPRRRRQATHRGRAAVEETSLATAPAGTPTGSPVTLGTSYSGGQMTATETAPSRPLDTGGAAGPRVVIDHVQVSTFGLDATVEVRLIAGTETAAGHSTGPAVDGYVLRLCAVAAAAAVDELLRGAARPSDRGRCFVEHAAVVPFGNCEVATVVVLLVCDGWVEQLAGSALVAGDPRQAVVRATLAAVNRRLEALLA
ncbi:hypothetical protein GA0070624_0204 [Micromonospora rhizosphaerae]|uniref:Uncharacterized protein n=1 Tax=Micromonospora rhizosphaerae TaxID=568872 RepID=A0A1C6R9D2_9ACTN|nr:hypothetical protein [Micromonospora rhizosphaerae]SCL13687.1 hypothetical protein GA0070624_0204 [Micromonospora rhizosphaerae]